MQWDGGDIRLWQTQMWGRRFQIWLNLMIDALKEETNERFQGWGVVMSGWCRERTTWIRATLKSQYGVWKHGEMVGVFGIREGCGGWICVVEVVEGGGGGGEEVAIEVGVICYFWFVWLLVFGV